MDVVLFLFVGVVAFCLLMLIVEPHRYLPEFKAKKKHVGSTYWGNYEGCPVEESEEMKTIEIKKSTRKEIYIAGSTTYALGRGVNMSGK